MYYILKRGNTSNTERFLQRIATKTTDYREDVMTIAEQLETKGEQRSIEKGIIVHNRQKGEHSASLKITKRLIIPNGVDRATDKISTSLYDDELASLFDDGR